ncbi:MAG: phosphatidylglycerol lysyltransferase domain-containing protein, partial [Albidovulum sp.]|uniref:phosphatidylglycerol lysyltransferase domain-containing protein n=1 Tax=Albidovulum sp. TaxID=1872424 RepID=UPI003CB28DC7
EHGEHFYHFEGLRAFKQKFDPVWTPHYLASPGGLAVPRVLYEINVLISGGVRGLVSSAPGRGCGNVIRASGRRIPGGTETNGTDTGVPLT